MGQGQLGEFLDQLARLGGVVSGLEAVVADPDRILFRHAAGYLVGGERLVAGSGARFDAASLTKPWIATLALVLDRFAKSQGKETGQSQGKNKSRSFHRGERLSAREGAGVEAEQLLRHASGMPAWTPLALRLGKRLGDPAALRDYLLEARLAGGTPSTDSTAPPLSPVGPSVLPFNGSLSLSLSPFLKSSSSLPPLSSGSFASKYSDLDFLLWGLLAEERTGESLALLLDERVCAPLGVAPLGALAAGGEVAGAVECRLDNGKEIELAVEQGLTLQRQRSYLRGVPQDGNARALLAVGRFPAHAGLFVSVDEMLALGREWLRPARLLSEAELASALSGDGDYALGWARWSEDGSSGPALSSSSFGHTGFTGGSLWIDPQRSRIYLLMAHRLSSALDFNPFRREFHRLAAEL